MNTWFRQNYENILRALCVAALIPITFICTGLTIFFANQGEVAGTISSFLPVFGQMIVLVVFVLFLVQLPFLFIKRNWFPLLNSLILAIGFLFWLHANVFNWNFGVLDGSSIDWKSFRYLAYRELFVDTLVLGILFWRHKWFSKYAIHFACILMLMQSIPHGRAIARETLPDHTKNTIRQILRMPIVDYTEYRRSKSLADVPHDPTIPSWKQYEITYDHLFQFSEQENVLLIILDKTEYSQFKEIIEKDFELREAFKDFTCFPNMLTERSGTNYCLPQILTGCETKEIDYNFRDDPSGEKRNEFLQRTGVQDYTLYKSLSQKGYRVDLYSMIPAVIYFDSRWMSNIRLVTDDKSKAAKKHLRELIELVMFRSVPTLLKPRFFDILFSKNSSQKDNVVKNENLQDEEIFESLGKYPQLSDIELLATINKTLPLSFSSIPCLKILHMRGGHEPWIMNENLQNVNDKDRLECHYTVKALSQYHGFLKICKQILDRLKELNTYNNSLVVIMGDHGCEYWNNYKRNYHRFCNPHFMIKRRNESHISIQNDMAPVHIKDVTPTILSELNLPIRSNSTSIFNIPQQLVEQRNSVWKKHFSAMKEADNITFLPFSSDDKFYIDKTVPMWASDFTDVECDARSNSCFESQLGLFDNKYLIGLFTVNNLSTKLRYLSDIHDLKMMESEKLEIRNWEFFCRFDFSNVQDGSYVIVPLLRNIDHSYTALSCTVLGLGQKITVTSGKAKSSREKLEINFKGSY